MGFHKLVRFGLNWELPVMFCALIIVPKVSSQINGCSIQDIEIQKCFNPGDGSKFFIDSCCKVLNQAVQAGFSCLCLLVASSIPLLSTPISLPLANCYISAPPLTLCHELAQIPVVFPPGKPKELDHLPPPAVVVPPPRDMQVPLGLAGIGNSTSVKSVNQQTSNQISAPKTIFSKWNYQTSGGTKISLRLSLFFSVAILHSLYILLSLNHTILV